MKCSLKWKNYMVCKVCKSMQIFNGSSSHLDRSFKHLHEISCVLCLIVISE